MTLQPEEKLREALARIIDLPPWEFPAMVGYWKERQEESLVKADAVIALFASYRPDGVGGEEGDPLPKDAIAGTDDGFTVYLDGYSGGGHKDGPWSHLTLRFERPKQLPTWREYTADDLFADRPGSRLPALPVEGGAVLSSLPPIAQPERKLGEIATFSGVEYELTELDPNGAHQWTSVRFVKAISSADSSQQASMGGSELKSAQVTEDDLAKIIEREVTILTGSTGHSVLLGAPNAARAILSHLRAQRSEP